jgi:ketosteroid isomerase-like protein
MSEENVELIRRITEAIDRRDIDGAVAVANPSVEWEDSMFWTERPRTYRGRAELREWINRVLEPWETIHVRAEEITETSNGRVLGFLRVTGRGSASGVETELQGWTVLWFENGLITARKIFRDRDDALEAAGLRE